MKMMESIKTQWGKYREIILYLVFGVATTGVNFIVYFGCRQFVNFSTNTSIVWAWFVSVLFAFLTNKYFVFDSKTTTKKSLVKEGFLFYWYRALSLVLELICMMILFNWLKWPEFGAKLITQVLIIVANYVFSKLFIFKSSNESERNA